MDNHDSIISLSELIDRMSINQIKIVLKYKDCCKDFKKEMSIIENDIDEILSNSKLELSSYFIRLIVALSQVNLHIWKVKEDMINMPLKFDNNMKLAHQLNGIRNQLKNKIVREIDANFTIGKKTNVETDNLRGWDMAILHYKDDSRQKCSRKSIKNKQNILITDLIDTLTICQIKEVMLPVSVKKECFEQFNDISREIDEKLLKNKVKVSTEIIWLLSFIAQANLHVWYNKDKMKVNGKYYYRLLEFAQNMNSLRNLTRNVLMVIFGELNEINKRAVFISNRKKKGFYMLINKLENKVSQTTKIDRLELIDFADMFGINTEEIPLVCRKIINERNFRYKKLDLVERDGVIRGIFDKLNSDKFWTSGANKKKIWDKGWEWNLRELKKTHDISALKPKFLKPNQIYRFKRDYISSPNPNFEFDLIDVYRHWAFMKYFKDVREIFEFGCGSCQHLPVLAELFPDKIIHGIDWADSSLKIIDAISKEKKGNIIGHRFNMFYPNYKFLLEKNCGILTIGAMEQLGKEYKKFLGYMLDNKPSIVVHMETIRELYDDSLLMDYIAIQYDKKRNYLSGYLNSLRELEKKGKIEIIKIKRLFFGSIYHDSYSLVVWKTK